LNAPLLVLDDAEARDRAAAELVRRGWRRADGFRLEFPGWSVKDRRVVCVGDVDSLSDAAAAVFAAARGAALVVRAPSDMRVTARLVDDLNRIGVVEYREPGRPLSDEDRAVLDLVAHGHRVREIARILHLSPRSVDRRLARARAALGVETTAEAVAVAVEPPDNDAT
jgi:DNA-binding NarL/FixJ family response regulator